VEEQTVARITVEDCLKQVNNRFLLVNMVAKRVRQIREGSEYLVNSPKNEDIVVALREVAAGKVRAREPRVEEPEGLLEAAPTAAETESNAPAEAPPVEAAPVDGDAPAVEEVPEA
jgi:DNA-directed RNA polymerase subunit omega